MDNICNICASEFTGSKDDLFKHIKSAHKFTKKKYIETFFPKNDLFDGTIIEYKSDDQYAAYDFNSVKNLNSWLTSQDKKLVEDYFKTKVTDYCIAKNLNRLPSYLELSLVKSIPQVDLVEKLTGLDFGKGGFDIKIPFVFDYSLDVNYIKKIKINSLIIDTREQLPFEFDGIDIINSKLEYGDYSVSKNSLVSIERKSLNDLRSTLSSGLERFKREIRRAQDRNGYIVVIVESTLKNFLYQKSKFGKCNPDFLAHNLREILREYSVVQFVFTENKCAARDSALKILSLDEMVRFIDLQYYLIKCRL